VADDRCLVSDNRALPHQVPLPTGRGLYPLSGFTEERAKLAVAVVTPPGGLAELRARGQRSIEKNIGLAEDLGMR
jgi:hypothetical protein